MTYYICILAKNADLSSISIGEYAKLAIQQHSQVGNKAPNLVNEPCIFVAVNNKAGLKTLDIKMTDTVRLSVNGMGNGYSYINIEGLSEVKDIFDELKALNVNIAPQVVYA